MKKHLIIPFFIPHLGCNNACIFCNQNSITGISHRINGKEVEEEINSFKLKERELVEVAFFGGSFTGIDESYQRELLGVAKKYKERGLIHKIRLSTRPDYINRVILNFLKDYSVDIIELGAQSMDNEVLELSKRGHTADDVREASKLIKEEGFELGLQMMVGLPGDTYGKSIDTAKVFADLKADCVRIYPSLLIKDTEMEKMFREGDYIPLKLEETVEILKDLLMFFEYRGIDVIRVGLQTTDSLMEGLVAGPYHPSIREMAESLIFREVLEGFLRDKKFEERKLLVFINRDRIASGSGYKKMNKIFFKKEKGIDLAFQESDKNGIRIKDKFYEINVQEYIKNYLIKKGIEV